MFHTDDVARPFVCWALQARLDELHGARAYTTVQHLSGKQIAACPVPLPPIGEQHRIVAKVEHLLALCNELEAESDRRADAALRFRRFLALHSLVNAEAGAQVRHTWDRVRDSWETVASRRGRLAKSGRPSSG